MAKAKGSTLIGAVKFLRSRANEARELLPDSLHHYLEEKILTSTWYPEDDLLAMVRAVVELLPGHESDVLALMGQETARSHRDGIYSHLFETGAAHFRTSSALWSSQHDTGLLTVTEESGEAIRLDLTDYALPSPELCTIIGAYIAEAMRLEGWIGKTEKVACRLQEDPCCSWRFTR